MFFLYVSSYRGVGKHYVTSYDRETQKSRVKQDEGNKWMAVKYIRTVVVDRHLAHSRQNRAVGSGGSANSCPSEVQHRDEELDDMDARDDGDVVDQSGGDVVVEVQPEGGHHPDNLGALAS